MYCQKCRTPLKLDGSLSELNPAAFDLLVSASTPQQQQPQQNPSRQSSSSHPAYPHEAERKSMYDRISKNAAPAMFKRQGSLRDNSMSFVLLSDSQLVPPKPAIQSTSKQRRSSMSTNGQRSEAEPHQVERIKTLFEIMSARSDIEHPVCVECTEMLVEGLHKRLETSSRERDAYSGYLKELQSDVPSAEEVSQSEKALAKARREKDEAIELLLQLEKEKDEAENEIAALEEEAQNLDAEEEHFWGERNAFASKLAEFQDERDSINSRYDHDTQLLQKLQRANVYNDTFSIHHDGHFATINGLRLGKLSHKPVDWPEINAAWGQALLLVTTVADKLGYRFEGLEPLPMGSNSKIIEYVYRSHNSSRAGNGPPPAPKKNVLELYASTSELPLQQLWNKKFEGAMVAFLELVRQLGSFVQNQTAGQSGDRAQLVLPYKIEHDKIGDDRIGHYSIKLGLTNEEGWTKACKFALTCCKFLIAHASNVSYHANGR